MFNVLNFYILIQQPILIFILSQLYAYVKTKLLNLRKTYSILDKFKNLYANKVCT